MAGGNVRPGQNGACQIIYPQSEEAAAPGILADDCVLKRREQLLLPIRIFKKFSVLNLIDPELSGSVDLQILKLAQYKTAMMAGGCYHLETLLPSLPWVSLSSREYPA
ncbi:predicted protein [Histoplasma capsulatum G186AR]|uniref:Uncharacterized protein n=1 Tax=Ajellomyces capsulatus (strain G186AR / H82 / ATCC MYA-2454 / RMSCC 2432) TaxID=447093 RepID=C0NGG9_AJECG|nr:uncharacterized protein HCBG_02441 [Histoplasma capsulatum G186AR]EEH08904.1 predicted protein [Histoplasma capsulatum G186AR]